MKKLLITALLVFTVLNASGQNSLNFGLGLGFPMGDSGENQIIAVNFDVSYLWEVSEQFDAGLTSGFLHSFGDSQDVGGGVIMVDTPDVSFLPIAGAARFNVSEDFSIGADLGYAVGISPDVNDGGFYYAPKAQYAISELLDVLLAYKGVSLDGGSFNLIALGLELGF